MNKNKSNNNCYQCEYKSINIKKNKRIKKKKMIINKWDTDEKTGISRIYQTKENSLEGLNHILKKYFYSKKENRSLLNLY